MAMKKRTTPKKSVKSNVRKNINKISKAAASKGATIRSGMKRKTQNMSKKKKTFINVVLTCLIAFIALFALGTTFIIIKAPAFDPNNLKFNSMSEVYDSEGNIIAKLGNENRTEISYDDLPEVLIDAIVATEDSKFFQHNGFDLGRFTVATAKQVLGRNGGGASTLTMQIVKNNYTSTVSSGIAGITRKFTDIYMAVFKVERQYTKKEILEFYVNDSYLGNGAYGVEQASQNYFGKSVKELNLSEAAFIAGLFQAPSSYDPYNYPEKAEARRKTVLYLMQRHKYITKEEKKIAEAQTINKLIKEVKVDTTYSEYQGYIDTVVEELEKEYNLNPYTTPLRVYTSMVKSKQDFVNKVMNGEAWTWENEKAQSGVVMTESATGEVIAVGAGRNKNSQRSYNFATMTNRQVGSTAKPIFDYGPAVQYLGWGTTNYITDAPYQYSNGKPISNSDGGYKGTLPMYQALGLSRNITALKTFQTVTKEAGNDKIVSFAKSLGITPELSNGSAHEAHSIGAFTGSTKKGESRNSPMTMAGAYGAFSNGGYYIKPHTIKKFVYKDTEEVVENSFKKQRVMYDSTAYIITYALHWSAQDPAGMAHSAAGISGVEVAAKTGTTNFDKETIIKNGLSSRALNDLWVCGYTSKYALTMWYGYDRIYKDAYSTQSSWSTRDKFYKNLAENLFDKDGSTFTRPSSIEEIEGGVLGLFRKGTGPKEYGAAQNNTTLPGVSGLSAKVSGNTVTLSWHGLSAEDMLDIASEDGYGTIGYDIYVKDGSGGKEVYLGTTTSNSYTHKTDLANPVYVVYTAFSNYKNNRSAGASVSTSIKTDFEVKVSNSNVQLNSTFTDNKPIIVLHNSIDVTDNSKIETLENNVNTSVAGTYTIKYRITYSGTSKEVSRSVIVDDYGMTP